jgi:UDP-N-acetylglucosamine diphosphorylase / glucose-1-phosphate thymidylyltransferase / UDP-N-acetylgalactosamine diphosphorylase / glucosamine-1-phosphate N-acetyltransferase / galactosamine-1-phosphate N-acetyltransferase
LSELDVARRMLPESWLRNTNVVLFEDERVETELFPLSVLRPVWEIHCGANSLRHWLASFEDPRVSLHLRPRTQLSNRAIELAGRFDSELDPDADTLLLNGRLIGLWSEHGSAFELPQGFKDKNGRVLWYRCRGAEAQKLYALAGNELAAALVQSVSEDSLPEGWTLLHAGYIWDYMRHNATALQRQLKKNDSAAVSLMGAHILREPPAGVSVTGKIGGHPVYVGQGVRMMPNVVLGNHTGPIWIGPHTDIEPHTYLEGPLYIGEHCRIKAGTRIYNGTTIGLQSRVAGEISSSVLQPYVNKQHDGFLGNSILGSWVNLGADTRTSNLRNDYGFVKVKVGGKLVESGERYIGVLCGDHTKTGINTMFNTGTVVGVAANVYGADYPPRFIPSFSWGGLSHMNPGDLERTLETARIAVSRRDCELSSAEEELLRRHYRNVINREQTS